MTSGGSWGGGVVVGKEAGKRAGSSEEVTPALTGYIRGADRAGAPSQRVLVGMQLSDKVIKGTKADVAL